MLTNINKEKRNDCLQFFRFQRSEKRYEQETNMFKRLPNTWSNKRYGIKGIVDDSRKLKGYYFLAAWDIKDNNVSGLMVALWNCSIYIQL